MRIQDCTEPRLQYFLPALPEQFASDSRPQETGEIPSTLEGVPACTSSERSAYPTSLPPPPRDPSDPVVPIRLLRTVFREFIRLLDALFVQRVLGTAPNSGEDWTVEVEDRLDDMFTRYGTAA